MGIKSSKELTQDIKRFAVENAHFDLVGISHARLPEHHESSLIQWLEKGHAGSLEYMKRDPQRRARPEMTLPGAKSVISLALNYYHPEDEKPLHGRQGKVSKYAYGRDYHKVIEKKLKLLAKHIEGIAPKGTQLKWYVDTGPLLEKAFAQQAGLGFFGKNTNIITRNFGSWVFLASIITDLELEADAPHTGSCGSCRICIDACPTDALLGDKVLDATRCISYWTIEAKEALPGNIKKGLGDWAFGCDICQDVCPYNFRAKTTTHTDLYPSKKAGTWINLDHMPEIEGSPLRRSHYLNSKK